MKKLFTNNTTTLGLTLLLILFSPFLFSSCNKKELPQQKFDLVKDLPQSQWEGHIIVGDESNGVKIIISFIDDKQGVYDRDYIVPFNYEVSSKHLKIIPHRRFIAQGFWVEKYDGKELILKADIDAQWPALKLKRVR